MGRFSGSLKLIQEGASLAALEQDYAEMIEDGLLTIDPPRFSEIVESCRSIQDQVNQRANQG